METWNKSVAGIVGLVTAVVVSALRCMGYYPLLPAFYASACLKKKRPYAMYIGFAIGMGYFMDWMAIIKYIVLLLVIRLVIAIYIRGNKKCSGVQAGIIAAVGTFCLNASGGIYSGADATEILLGIGEAFLVLAGTILFHTLGELAKSFGGVAMESFAVQPPAIQSAEGIMQGRMQALAFAVDGLSEIFRTMSIAPVQTGFEEVCILEQELTGTFCRNCKDCGACWVEHKNQRTDCVHRMIEEVMKHKSKEELVDASYLLECPQYPDMVELAIGAFGRMELNRAWYQRLLENRQMIAQQFDALVELMDGWTKGEKLIDSNFRLQRQRILFEAKERGILVQDLHVYKDERNHRYIRARVATKWGGGIPTKNYLEALEKATHLSLRLEKEARSILTTEWQLITAYQNTKYYALSGMAARKKDGSAVNGDNFTIFELESGEHCTILSDGMGSGMRASEESDLVVDLSERLIRAGFKREMAIRMMNAAMVMHAEEQSYSTLDLASIDLYSGELEIMKIGAAASFIKRKDEVVILSAQTLPAGADPSLKPDTLKEKLQAGDYLILLTDGATDYLPAQDVLQCIATAIGEIEQENAGAFAKELLDWILKETNGYAPDDMTILVVSIWER